MTNHINIDPGFASKGPGCACALFQSGSLDLCWYERASIHPRAKLAAPAMVDCVVDIVRWEMPQADGRGANGDTLIQLASEGRGLATQLAMSCGGTIAAVTPAEWKGAARKPQHHRRVWLALTEDERLCVDDHPDRVWKVIEKTCEKGALDRWKKPGVQYYPKSFVTHNMLDAVAIGLHAEGRI